MGWTYFRPMNGRDCMKVIVERLSEDAKIPTQAHDRDFCYDVYATSCREVEPGVWEYGIGLAFEIVRPQKPISFGGLIGIVGVSLEDLISTTDVKLSLDFRPRSSVWHTGLVLSNCEGTIDELYRGEVKAYFYEVIKGREKYAVGDRIGQIKLGITIPLEFIEGKVNANTERGCGGFGSSGR